MEGFGLILGHLLGDYVLQNDWQATNKTSSHPACLIHCTLYTLAVFLCSFWWLAWWAYPVVWLAHFPVDRWRLARKWMHLVGQEQFATGPLAPWSIIAVDNTFHLLVLFLLGMFGVAK